MYKFMRLVKTGSMENPNLIFGRYKIHFCRTIFTVLETSRKFECENKFPIEKIFNFPKKIDIRRTY